jgi:hypothetical protein
MQVPCHHVTILSHIPGKSDRGAYFHFFHHTQNIISQLNPIPYNPFRQNIGNTSQE